MAYADLRDLEDLLDFDLTEQAQRAATQKIQAASDMAQHYSGMEWAESRAPRIVKSIVLNVVERYMRNPDNYIQSRAGDETLMWDDTGNRGAFYFTDEEKEILKGLGKRGPAIYSVSTSYAAPKKKSNTIWVTVDGQPRVAQPSGDPTLPPSDGGWFPLFNDEDPVLQ